RETWPTPAPGPTAATGSARQRRQSPPQLPGGEHAPPDLVEIDALVRGVDAVGVEADAEVEDGRRQPPAERLLRPRPAAPGEERFPPPDPADGPGQGRHRRVPGRGERRP